MTKRDNTYQNARVTLPQGGTMISFDSDAIFDFYADNQLTGTEVNNFFKGIEAGTKAVTYGQSTDSTKFSVINIPNTAKYVFFSMTSNLAQGSAWLTSGCLAGQEMWLAVHRGSVASGMVLVSTSGVTINGLHGSSISIIRLYNSVASTGAVHLVCTTDGAWTIVESVSLAVVAAGVAVPD